MQPWGVLFSPGSPAAFPSPWIKASGFASHPFEWFALSDFFYPQITPVKFASPRLNPLKGAAEGGIQLGKLISGEIFNGAGAD